MFKWYIFNEKYIKIIKIIPMRIDSDIVRAQQRSTQPTIVSTSISFSCGNDQQTMLRCFNVLIRAIQQIKYILYIMILIYTMQK